MIATKRVEDEGLVRLRDLDLREATLVRQVHLGRDRARVQARRLRVQLEVDGLGRLDADDELVAGDVLEDALRDVLELDPDLDLRLVERWIADAGGDKLSGAEDAVARDLLTFAGLEDERHALPPGVVDPKRRRGERRADRVVRDSIVVEVPGLAVRSDILAKERVTPLNGRDRTKDLDLRRDMGG